MDESTKLIIIGTSLIPIGFILGALLYYVVDYLPMQEEINNNELFCSSLDIGDGIVLRGVDRYGCIFCDVEVINGLKKYVNCSRESPGDYKVID